MPEFQGRVSKFEDRILKCFDCGTDFVFTAGEQQFFHEKEFRNEPRRCKACKSKRRDGAKGGRQATRVETSAKCAHCGRETTLPFLPTQGRPVYCRDCFKEKRVSGASA